jgi:hypothetical protein
MEPFEIIVIVASILFVGSVIYKAAKRKKQRRTGCASEYGCSAVSDMKRAFKDARKSIKEKE